MHVSATKPGFYCPAWDWTFGAPVQMVRIVAFTPSFGWGDAEGRAPVSVWALPEDHGDAQVRREVQEIGDVLAKASPSLEPAPGMQGRSIPVQLRSKMVVQLGDELFIMNNWKGHKRGLKVSGRCTLAVQQHGGLTQCLPVCSAVTSDFPARGAWEGGPDAGEQGAHLASRPSCAGR